MFYLAMVYIMFHVAMIYLLLHLAMVYLMFFVARPAGCDSLSMFYKLNILCYLMPVSGEVYRSTLNTGHTITHCICDVPILCTKKLLTIPTCVV